jgi:hypothetical protein
MNLNHGLDHGASKAACRRFVKAKKPANARFQPENMATPARRIAAV